MSDLEQRVERLETELRELRAETRALNERQKNMLLRRQVPFPFHAEKSHTTMPSVERLQATTPAHMQKLIFEHDEN